MLVTLEIQKNVLLTQGSKVLLTSELLGGSALMLQIAMGGKQLQQGDTLVADSEKGIQALLQEQALPVVKNADSLIINLNRIVKQFDQTGYVLNKLLTSAVIDEGFDKKGCIGFKLKFMWNRKNTKF